MVQNEIIPCQQKLTDITPTSLLIFRMANI